MPEERIEEDPAPPPLRTLCLTKTLKKITISIRMRRVLRHLGDNRTAIDWQQITHSTQPVGKGEARREAGGWGETRYKSCHIRAHKCALLLVGCPPLQLRIKSALSEIPSWQNYLDISNMSLPDWKITPGNLNFMDLLWDESRLSEQVNWRPSEL